MPFCQIPSRLRYQIVRQVGEGSAVVYQARANEVGLPQIVALKATTVGRALHEARILASLQHPSIPRFYDLVVDDLLAYVVMEYIEGETLTQYLDAYLAQGTLPQCSRSSAWGSSSARSWTICICASPPSRFATSNQGM
ncbi:MAG: protein kinase domain-containing protein [Ktedonobacteraceae bacterium]